MTRFLTLFALLSLCSIATAQVDFGLPRDGGTVIFKMEFGGGERMPAPVGFERQPFLQIFASGRVLHSPNTPAIKATEYQMTDDELNAFLGSVVNDHGFYEVDGDKIKQEFDDAGHQLMVADAPTITLHINLSRGEHETSLYGSFFMKRAMPENEGLENFDKIVGLGRKQAAIADAGGQEALAAYLDKANAKMEENNQEPFELSDFQRASRHATRTMVSFSKQIDAPTEEDANGKAQVTVSFAVPDDGEETVKYRNSPIAKRRNRTPGTNPKIRLIPKPIPGVQPLPGPNLRRRFPGLK